MAIIFWLNDLPWWQAGMLLTGGAFLLSIVGAAFARVFVEEPQLTLNNVIGGFQYMFLSQVYAGFIGFLLFGVYDRYDAVRTTMVTEVSAMTTLDRLAQAFPEGTRTQIRASLREYGQDVIMIDWPNMQNRSGDISTIAALDDLEYVFGAIEGTSRKQREIVQVSRELVTQLRDDRAARMLRSYGSMPVLLWAVSILATLVAVGVPWVFGTPNVNADIVMSTLTVVMMTAILLVVLKLSYPFGGSGGLSPDPYQAYMARPSGG